MRIAVSKVVFNWTESRVQTANNEIYVPFGQGFRRSHWSMRRDVIVFRRNKMAGTRWFSVSFYVVNVIFKSF